MVPGKLPIGIIPLRSELAISWSFAMATGLVWTETLKVAECALGELLDTTGLMFVGVFAVLRLTWT